MDESLQGKTAWELADFRDPFVFSLCLYEEPALMLEMMRLFFPGEKLKRLLKVRTGLADVLHGSRSDPCFRAEAEGIHGRVTLQLDYIRELTENPRGDYHGHSLHPQEPQSRRTLNLTICRYDPFCCDKPVMMLSLSSRDLSVRDEEEWTIEGVLISLHDQGDVPSPAQQELIDFLRSGRAEGDLPKRMQEAAERVRDNPEWELLYLEEEAYRRRLLEKE